MAADAADNDPLIVNPNYTEHIYAFFREKDIGAMRRERDMDLGSYEGVMRNASRIYTQTKPPHAQMPDDHVKWSVNRSLTFRNWMSAGYPLDSTPVMPTFEDRVAPKLDERLRKNVDSMTREEIEALKAAFTVLMERPYTRDDSYYALAAIHGVPQRWCVHHDDLFYPWHRAYLRVFEDALRTVPGCADVTMPYWDITKPLPALLQAPPFDSYELPIDPGRDSPSTAGKFFPLTTKRHTPDEIARKLKKRGVTTDLTLSLEQARWGFFNDSGYQDVAQQFHDGGHGSIGPTMATHEISSFDPLFWFFHSNIDRLWLNWQIKADATTVEGFKARLDGGGSDWLFHPVVLAPWTLACADTIDFKVSYDDEAPQPGELRETVGSVVAERSFSIRSPARISVRVKGIERLNIPGSFDVNLLADGEEIASRFFFQPNQPRQCENCTKLAKINIGFRIPLDDILDRELSVTIEARSLDKVDRIIPLAQAGSPTINARLLLDV